MADNVPEYSVTELSGAIKRTVEDAFGYVRVRGELGRVSRSGNGHCYLDLKDERAVLSSVIWKGSWGRLSIKPEQGMEVVATGRLTTFAGQSRYQLVIDTLEPAGAGALMALLEERKKRLAAEGLFAAERKKSLPKMPGVVGVVTSPTGAVIRDILHRLRDRFPCHVLVWPSAVQGEAAPKQIIAGIEGFNHLSKDGPVPRPDVLIVARGGGSLEDLWGFNDEGVARAAAASDIPLISAVGHETDTTLIDYVSDWRAPTPTAAAEMAVPVRIDLLNDLSVKSGRLSNAVARGVERRKLAFESAERGLGKPDTLLQPAEQRFDRAAEGLTRALRIRLDQAERRFDLQRSRFAPSLVKHQAAMKAQQLRNFAGRLSRRTLEQRIDLAGERVTRAGHQLRRMTSDRIATADTYLADRSRLLSSLSYRGVLDRGFALVMDDQGSVLRRADQGADGSTVSLRFADGDRSATLGEGVSPPPVKPKSRAKPAPKKGVPQATLFDE